MADGHVEKCIRNADVGTMDQHLALALDELRSADEFVLIVPTVREGVTVAKLLTTAKPVFIAEAARVMSFALETVEELLDDDAEEAA